MSTDPVIRLSQLTAREVPADALHAISRELLRDVSATVAAYRPILTLDRLCDAAPPPADQRERVESLARVREAAAMMRERFFGRQAA